MHCGNFVLYFFERQQIALEMQEKEQPYIVAAKLKSLPNEIKEKILDRNYGKQYLPIIPFIFI